MYIYKFERNKRQIIGNQAYYLWLNFSVSRLLKKLNLLIKRQKYRQKYKFVKLLLYLKSYILDKNSEYFMKWTWNLKK
jgi:hypothetical protein